MANTHTKPSSRRPDRRAQRAVPSTSLRPKRILAIDVGGTTVKFLLSGKRRPRRFPSGNTLGPVEMVRRILASVADWKFDAIALGLPGRIGERGLVDNPDNLGPGWVGFDFGSAFGVPVRIINDAAMQAIGSYEGKRMLFIGLGTGLGSSLVTGRTIVSLELGRILLRRDKTLGELVSKEALQRHGRKTWRRRLLRIIPSLREAVLADYVIVGGGNARRLEPLPANMRRGHNDNAFRGGFRLWDVEGVPLHPGGRRVRVRSDAAKLDWRSV